MTEATKSEQAIRDAKRDEAAIVFVGGLIGALVVLIGAALIDGEMKAAVFGGFGLGIISTMIVLMIQDRSRRN